MAKHLYSLRFRPDLYSAFKTLAKANGYTVTGAFEHFMVSCVEADRLVFPDGLGLDFKAEARVVVDWLSKGQLIYREETFEELNIRGRLLGLLPRVNDAVLKKSIEQALKLSITKNVK